MLDGLARIKRIARIGGDSFCLLLWSGHWVTSSHQCLVEKKKIELSSIGGRQVAFARVRAIICERPVESIHGDIYVRVEG